MHLRLFLALALLAASLSPLAAQSGPMRARDRFAVIIGGEEFPLVVIGPDGHATFPVIGTVRVAGLIPLEAERVVLEAMRGISARPDITVRALRRVVVEGEVARTEVLYVEDGTTVSEAIVRAGGVTYIGDRARVELRRSGRPVATLDVRGGEDRLATLQSGDEVVVRRLPWYARSGVILTSAVTTVVSWLVIGTR